MLIKYFKNKFNKDKEIPVEEQFFSPLRIALHTTIELNTVDWIIIKESLNKSTAFPKGKLDVNAIGETKVDTDVIYTVYLEDAAHEEFILQLYCVTNNGVSVINEAILFKQVVELFPMSESEWDVEMQSLGMPTLDLDGNTYKRAWNRDYNGKIDLADFNETVYRMGILPVKYTNHYMLYDRQISSAIGEQNELLLVGVEETENSANITMMVGMNIPLANIKIQ